MISIATKIHQLSLSHVRLAQIVFVYLAFHQCIYLLMEHASEIVHQIHSLDH